MFKKLTTLSAAIVLTGCATTSSAPLPLDVNNNCILETIRIQQEYGTASGELLKEYWATQTDVMQPILLAAAMQTEIPPEWHTEFSAKVEQVFSAGYMRACATQGATIESASRAAAGDVVVWITAFEQLLEEEAQADTTNL